MSALPRQTVTSTWWSRGRVAPEPDKAAEPGLTDQLLDIGATVLAMARTRAELFQEDLLEGREAVFAQVRLAVITWTAAVLAGVGVIVWITVALPPDVTPWVLGAVVTILAGVALWAGRLRQANRLNPARPFRRFLEQLSQDGAALRPRQPVKPA